MLGNTEIGLSLLALILKHCDKHQHTAYAMQCKTLRHTVKQALRLQTFRLRPLKDEYNSVDIVFLHRLDSSTSILTTTTQRKL